MLPADGVKKELDDEGSADGAAKVDASQLIDLLPADGVDKEFDDEGSTDGAAKLDACQPIDLLPADGVDKECDDEGSTDGAAKVDAGQLIDLTLCNLEVLIPSQAACDVGLILCLLHLLRDELGRAVGRAAHQQVFIGQLRALIPPLGQD